LTSASGVYGSFTYGYDASGNMTSKEGKSYTYTGHRVTSGTGFTATYDAAGNRIGQTRDGNTWAYTYDGERRLKTVTKNGTVMNQFGYDFLGERVRKVDANGTLTHYVSPNYEVVYATDGRTLVTKYVQAPTGRVASITTQIPANGGAMFNVESLNVIQNLFAKNTVAGLAKYVENRAMVLALQPWARPIALALVGLLIAWTTLRLARQYRPMQLRRTLDTLGTWLWPSGTAYSRRHPLFALATPFVLASFLAACGQAPGQTGNDENTASSEEALTAGLNGAGIPEVGTVYFHNNHLGSSSLVTDSSGNVKTRVEYKPYGEIVDDSSTGPDMFRAKFTGKEWDKDSELYDYHARHYDPFTGRFLTADSLLSGGSAHSLSSGGPQGEGTALNPYAYANNNPVTYTDPSGNFFFLAVVVAAAVGAYSGGMATNGTWNPAQWNWNSWQTYVGIGAGALAGGISGGLGASATTSTMMSRAMMGCALEAVVTNGLRFISPEGSTWKDFGIGVAQDMAMGYAMAKAKPLAKAKATSLWNKITKSGSQAATEAGREGAGAAAKAAGKPSNWKNLAEAAKDVGKGALKAGTKIGGFEARQHVSLSSITSTMTMPNPRAANRPPPRRTDGSTVADYFRDFQDAVLSASGADDVRGRVAGDWTGQLGGLSVARGAKRAPQAYGGFAVLH
jgi:RHS repeat-associated protein